MSDKVHGAAITGGAQDSAVILSSKPSDPFDTNDPQWTLEAHLRAYVQKSKESAIASGGSNHASVVWQDVAVFGEGAIATYQDTVLGLFTAPVMAVAGLFRVKKARQAELSERPIIQGFDGVVKNGEMLLLIGRPGAGCTTLLKTLGGMTDDYKRWQGTIEFSGVPVDVVRKRFRGDVVYNQERDIHFPHLNINQTLQFAVETRAPHVRIPGYSRRDYVTNIRDLLATTFGLRHVLGTKVGDNLIAGASGGERKRVSIAEMLATRASVGLWDNATRGLDASTSFEYARAIRTATNLLGNIAIAALYQASENITDVFDKVTVLYAGRQIFFGSVSAAREHFHDLGFVHPPRQTVADFLTTITDPNARIVRDGFERRAPRTPEDFVQRWRESVSYRKMLEQINEHKAEFGTNNIQGLRGFEDVQKANKARRVREKSVYTVNTRMQMSLLMKRAYQRTRADKTLLFAGAFAALFLSLVVGSVYYNITPTTDGFFSRTGVMFFVMLFISLQSLDEIGLLYANRPIISKQKSYAMYHPAIEAIATMTAEYPIKLFNVILLDVIFYFLSDLKRDAGNFFIFLLFTYLLFLVMSSLFRTVGAATKTIESALSIAGLLILALTVYSGYIIPQTTMHPWFKWITYIDPLRYAFEALMGNEFHDFLANCANLVPSGTGYESANFANQVCAVTGSRSGSSFVSGDDYIRISFDYSHSHLWRNFGILVGFWLFFTFTYALATELQTAADTKGEFLVFKKGRGPKFLEDALQRGKTVDDLEGTDASPQNINEELETIRQNSTSQVLEGLVKSTDIFTWQNVCYGLQVEDGSQKRLLDNINGYVKPGTLTALMGASGAGKTTLLNVLARRVDPNVITGDMLVNGSPLDVSFQRKTGYVRQQDVHLAEATVREALRFSALLRQPAHVPVAEKYSYVERVITMLEMEHYAEAIIGSPGSGLNVEQRKRTTIGVELVAKPALLLFLDEPTSGLDSQSAWSIVKILRKLANSGQAILCTIHQPSGLLFEQFDRLLLLQAGGQTVYFGDIGENSQTVTGYFEAHGAPKCPETANPAEYMLEVIGAGATARANDDWHRIWEESQEHLDSVREVSELQSEFSRSQVSKLPHDDHDAGTKSFATPWFTQYRLVQGRIFQHYWRSPIYIFGKVVLNVFAGLFLGFTFYKEHNSVAGLQNKLFAIFMAALLSFPLMTQLQPRFIILRDIYEIREKQSKMYHWSTIILSNIVVEICYNLVGTTLFFLPWYYAVGFSYHVEHVGNRPAYTWLAMMLFAMYYSTLGQVFASIAPDATVAGLLTTLLSTFVIIFNGVLQPASRLPHFWKFMYRASPYTYLIGGLLSNAIHDIDIVCAPAEINVFQPPKGQTCQGYAGAFLHTSPGNLLNPNATADCQYCRYDTGDQFLATLGLSWDQRWRDIGLLCAYILFNVFLIFSLFFLFRVVVWKKKKSVVELGAMKDAIEASRVALPPSEEKLAG